MCVYACVCGVNKRCWLVEGALVTVRLLGWGIDDENIYDVYEGVEESINSELVCSLTIPTITPALGHVS